MRKYPIGTMPTVSLKKLSIRERKLLHNEVGEDELSPIGVANLAIMQHHFSRHLLRCGGRWKKQTDAVK